MEPLADIAAKLLAETAMQAAAPRVGEKLKAMTAAASGGAKGIGDSFHALFAELAGIPADIKQRLQNQWRKVDSAASAGPMAGLWDSLKAAVGTIVEKTTAAAAAISPATAEYLEQKKAAATSPSVQAKTRLQQVQQQSVTARAPRTTAISTGNQPANRSSLDFSHQGTKDRGSLADQSQEKQSQWADMTPLQRLVDVVQLMVQRGIVTQAEVAQQPLPPVIAQAVAATVPDSVKHMEGKETPQPRPWWEGYSKKDEHGNWVVKTTEERAADSRRETEVSPMPPPMAAQQPQTVTPPALPPGPSPDRNWLSQELSGFAAGMKQLFAELAAVPADLSEKYHQFFGKQPKQRPEGNAPQDQRHASTPSNSEKTQPAAPAEKPWWTEYVKPEAQQAPPQPLPLAAPTSTEPTQPTPPQTPWWHAYVKPRAQQAPPQTQPPASPQPAAPNPAPTPPQTPSGNGGGMGSKLFGMLAGLAGSGKAAASGIAGRLGTAAMAAAPRVAATMGGLASPGVGMAAAGLAATGPTGAVVATATAVVIGLAALPKIIKVFGESLVESNRELANYNATIAASYASYDQAAFFRKLDLADATSGSASVAAEEWTKTLDSLQGPLKAISTGFNTWSTGVAVMASNVPMIVQMMTGGIVKVGVILDAIERIRKDIEKMAGQGTGQRDWGDKFTRTFAGRNLPGKNQPKPPLAPIGGGK